MAKVTISPVVFPSGSRFHEGDDLNKAFWSPQWSTSSGLSGGVPSAPTVLGATLNQFASVAGGTVVALPSGANVTKMVVVLNDAAGGLTIVTKDGSTIDGIAGATGVTLSAGKRAMFFYVAPGVWESAQMGAASA